MNVQVWHCADSRDAQDAVWILVDGEPAVSIRADGGYKVHTCGSDWILLLLKASTYWEEV